MTKLKKTINIKGQEYQLLSQLFEEKHMVYRNFIISLQGKPVFMYELGITKIALLIYKEDITSDLLIDKGVKFIQEMFLENNFSHTSGVITTIEMSKGEFTWKKLSPLNKDFPYTQ